MGTRVREFDDSARRLHGAQTTVAPTRTVAGETVGRNFCERKLEEASSQE